MNWREHKAGGVLFGTVTAVFLTTNSAVANHPLTAIIPIFASSYASMLPDLDKKGTHASNLMPYLADKLGSLGHRTVLHSLVIPTINLVVTTILAIIANFFSSLAVAIILTVGYGLSMGWYSHLAYDIITPMGCPLFEPFISDRWSIYHLNNNRDGKWVLLATVILEILPLITLIRFLAISLIPALPI